MPYSLSASVVVFESAPALLRRTLEALAVTIGRAQAAGLLGTARVTLVDNDAPQGALVDEAYAQPPGLPAADITWRRRAGHGNVGFGRGHNLVLRGSAGAEADLSLVLNPDALLAPDALEHAIAWLRDNAACGMAVPNGTGPDGRPLFLCKRYPDALTLLLRAAGPRSLRARFGARLARYELRDVVGDAGERAAQGVQLASGCCMLLRRAAIAETAGFDPAFFVYFEDYDLSLRLARTGTWRIDYLPAMRLVHYGGNAAQKSFAHVRLFAASAIRFFNKHGWKFA